MADKPQNNPRRDALKTLFRGIGVLGLGGFDGTKEEHLENINEAKAQESNPEDILNDWEHLLDDD